MEVNVHDYEGSGFANYANDLTSGRDFSKNLIGFNNKPGDGGTHWTTSAME